MKARAIVYQAFTALMTGSVLLAACSWGLRLKALPTSITDPKATIEPPVPAATWPQTTMPTLVIQASPPTAMPAVALDAQGNGSSFAPSLSADGRFVAFASNASNLVSADINGVSDIFVLDRQASTIELVSLANDGTSADGWSDSPSISSDGRWIAFVSTASNLVPGNANRDSIDLRSVLNIFVYDRQTDVMECVSTSSDGAPASGWSHSPRISDDGRYVAFVSDADNLVTGDLNGRTDIFVYDRRNRQTELASVMDDGTQLNGISDWVGLSADGRLVVFGGRLESRPSGPTYRVFTRDRAAGTTVCVGEGFAPNISPDGRWIAFVSTEATDGWFSLFVYDRQTGGIVEVGRVLSEETHGRPSNEWSFSADGRWLAFGTGSNPITGVSKGYDNVFLYDQHTGTVELVSSSRDGTPGNSSSGHASISSDGRFVAFQSNATNLTPGDTNQASDVFVYDRLTGCIERAR